MAQRQSVRVIGYEASGACAHAGRTLALMPTAPLATGSVSLRMYPHALPAAGIVSELREQAALAERAGFDGLMTSEHHGGFAGYLPQPTQVAGFLLDATQRIWAAACPLLLALRHWSHAAEEIAWLAARFPGRLGAGFGIGGLDRDFELADLDYGERRTRYRAFLPLAIEALRGRAQGLLAEDSALAACADAPVPVVCAAQGPRAAREAAALGAGLLLDSLPTAESTRRICDAYSEAGGSGPRIGIRRAWLGPPPREAADQQMDVYRGYTPRETQRSWGNDELIWAAAPSELAERLADFGRRAGCDALNLRVHLTGLEPARVRDQISTLGEALGPLRERWKDAT